MQKLYVFYQNQLVGELLKLSAKQLQFSYASEWLSAKNAFALSISLPLSVEPFEHAETFFANMLPEGEVRDALCRKLGLSIKNDFGLLAEVGGEVAGAISIFDRPVLPDYETQRIELDETKLVELLEALKTTPFKALDGEIRLSLAGAQNKLPVIKLDDTKTRFALPVSQDLATTHIIKLRNPHFENLVLNEVMSMRLAKAVGLNVPDVGFLRVADELHFIVERYDRIRGKRLHQEDFCQAMGIDADNKYETEGGPSLKACSELIRQYSHKPAADMMQFVRWVLFNIVIGNRDAHGKNIAFLYQPKCELTPFYDLLSTQCYQELSDKFSMKIGGENRLEWLQKRHFERFADEVGVKFSLIQKEFKKLVNLIEKNEHLLNEFEPLQHVVTSNISRLKSKLEK
ncbi:type II toxin-antitoxin system HipA family toxin [Thiomicrorhabdus heinhorstiae]|uniref:Type II toxin-antitoxin system HipA family toxin n=1 Tax=Thiomicrorhabdus heinhorstiae TaxID=2748010 RepID=A0ABS0BWA6_9GAMM|nr:type II toxin-antitoxin system HipA family toxin [Thiomicrorhabdus heinhorstiae]MBF6058069.1 type II toxin-antitoxin system HipA family toxin [Thiomicrorhabdus heinhorstiae]